MQMYGGGSDGGFERSEMWKSPSMITNGEEANGLMD